MEKAEVELVLKAARLDWSDIDPSIFGTLFERGLNPDKRSQLGAHYTDRDKIMMIMEPVIIRPLQAEWGILKLQIARRIDTFHTAGSCGRALQSLERLLGGFMTPFLTA